MTEGKAIQFVVEGLAVPQGRSRAVVTSKGVHVYDPKRSRDWKAYFRMAAMKFKPEQPLDGPLALSVSFFLPRPKSRPKRDTWPDRKPDLSNLLKAVEDAMTGVFWRDDSQIVRAVQVKRYAGAYSPRVYVEVGPVDDYYWPELRRIRGSFWRR